MRHPLLTAILVLFTLAGVARGDSVWVMSAGGGGVLELANVRILRIESGRLLFRAAGGETSRDLSQVHRIALDDEPGLSAAEAAFVAGDYDTASEAYVRVARSTAKPWLRQWASLRLMTAAHRSGRFDAAVSAYVQLVQQDAVLAQANRPTIDPSAPPRPGVLESASAEIERTLERNRQLTPEQRRALLQLQLEIHRAWGDTARTARTLEALLAVGGGGVRGGGGGVGESEASGRALADLRLSTAAVALDGGDPRRAAAVIRESAALLTDPRQQAEALFLLAQAAEAEARTGRGGAGPAGPGGTAGSGGGTGVGGGMGAGGADRVKLQDAALAYMRVVAHFRGVAGADRRVPAAALRAATLLEELGERAEARSLYRDLAEGRIAPVDGAVDNATLEAARRGVERLR